MRRITILMRTLCNFPPHRSEKSPWCFSNTKVAQKNDKQYQEHPSKTKRTGSRLMPGMLATPLGTSPYEQKGKKPLQGPLALCLQRCEIQKVCMIVRLRNATSYSYLALLSHTLPWNHNSKDPLLAERERGARKRSFHVTSGRFEKTKAVITHKPS
jgi:hypothetical protein